LSPSKSKYIKCLFHDLEMNWFFGRKIFALIIASSYELDESVLANYPQSAALYLQKEDQNAQG
jgi:hypothetical protein